MIRPTWIAAITNDSDVMMFTAINHMPSPFGIREVWILTQVKWFFGTCPPFSQSARFPNGIFTSCPNNSSLNFLAHYVVSSMTLDSPTKRDQFGCCCKTECMICVGVLNKSGKPIRRWVQSMKRWGDLGWGGSRELMKSDGILDRSGIKDNRIPSLKMQSVTEASRKTQGWTDAN